MPLAPTQREARCRAVPDSQAQGRRAWPCTASALPPFLRPSTHVTEAHTGHPVTPCKADPAPLHNTGRRERKPRVTATGGPR